jgi:hypothetical protein
MGFVIRYTNAPDVYDYEWTVMNSTTVPWTCGSGMDSTRPFRRVELDDREHGFYVTYQIYRYQSGGYLVLTQAQWDVEIANGFLVIPEDADVATASPPVAADASEMDTVEGPTAS